MDDIHAPTVSSGPTSGGYTNGVPKEQLSLQELIAEKERVETELKALGQVLDSVRLVWTLPGLLADRCFAAWCDHEHWPYDFRWIPTQRHRCSSKYGTTLGSRYTRQL